MPRDPLLDAPISRSPWRADLRHEPFAAVFRARFAEIRAAHRAHPEEGVLIAAVDGTGFLDAHAHLRLPRGGTSHLILGRHDRCDVVLPRDPGVSLRHLLLRATRAHTGQVHLRAIDLRSRVGLLSEEGRPCAAIVSRGPLFLQVGSYLLFLLPTGPRERPWADDADATWAGFAPRDQEILPPPQPLKSRDAPAAGSLRLAALSLQSPVRRPGELTSTHAVWSCQLERGILIGRDDRCSHGTGDEGNLSRVHLVLLSVDDEVWAIDTASTNGSRLEHGAQFRQLRLAGDACLLLADALALRWKPELLSARA